MAGISSPFPLSSTPLSQNVYISTVTNSASEVVVAADGEGLSIHHIAPNRVVSSYSVGPDIKFLCAPVSVRNTHENTVTWAFYDNKGDLTLVCWTQNGVECNTHTIHITGDKPFIHSLLSIGNVGESILVNFGHARLECYGNGETSSRWGWDIPGKPNSLTTFKSSESLLTKNIVADVLLVLGEQSIFYPISAVNPPENALVSIPLDEPAKAVSTTFHAPSSTIYQLFRKSLTRIRQNQPPKSHYLSQKYDRVYPLSASHVLLASPHNIIILDTEYGTTQATLSLSSTLHTIVPTNDPLSFHAIVDSDHQALVVPLVIPPKATLLDAIGKGLTPDLHTKKPPIFLSTKIKMKSKDVEAAIKELFKNLKAADDGDRFDSIFKAFRKKFQINRRVDRKRTTRLSTAFVRELMALIFVKSEDGVSFRIYPDETIKFLLEGSYFSRDLLPGGAEGLVPSALSKRKFLKRLLEKEPTPFTYRDYLLLVKYILDTPEDKTIVSTEIILDSFERDADTFFERPAMKTILSTDQLQQFLAILTRDSEDIPYPSLLTAVLDSIGLGPLMLTQALPLPLLETIHSFLTSETEDLSQSLQTSSMLSLILHRQNDIPPTRQKDREIFQHGMKRKLGETGWLDIVAEQGGMTRQQKIWMKKPVLPGSGRELTHRFVATTKFQEAPSYSLDRMVL